MARMPAAVVLAAILVVDCCGKKSDAASSGDLLLFNNASDSVEVSVAQSAAVSSDPHAQGEERA